VKLTLQDLVASLAGAGAWDRGLQLFRERAVLDAHVTGHGMEARLASDRGFELVSLSFRHRRLTSRCTCANHTGLCEHAVACLLMLADEKPELIAFIRASKPASGPPAPPAQGPPPDQDDQPAATAHRARNPQLTMEALRQLLRTNAPESWLSLHCDTPLGTMESQWNRLAITAQLHHGDALYAQGNIRRLVETGRCAGGMVLDDFAPQEQQAMRFLVTQAEFGSASIHLTAPVLADLFHALGGFGALYVPDGRIQVHPERLETVIEVTRHEDGSLIRPRLCLPDHGHLPAGRPTYITGRAGYWIGCGTEYWWLPGFFPTAWLHLFLHARGLELNDIELARLQQLCARHRVQSRLVVAGGLAEVTVQQGRCRPVLNLDWDQRGIHALIAFGYGGVNVGLDGPGALWDNRRLIGRDAGAEQASVQRLRDMGFKVLPGRRECFHLAGAEPVWEFVRHHLPGLESVWDLYWSPRFGSHLRATGDLRLRLRAGEESGTWFEARCELLDGEGRRVPWEDVVQAIRQGRTFLALSDGTTVRLPGDVRRVLNVLETHGRAREGGQAFRFERHAAIPLAEAAAPFCEGEPTPWQRLRDQLLAPATLPRQPVPPDLWLRLRPYQRCGVAWIQLLEACGVHGILADEMGLGKTVQALAALAARALAGSRAPSLVVCPTSLVQNWLMEAARFVPGLRCVAIQGNDRRALIGRLPEVHLAVTSYALLRRDIADYDGVALDYLILDEAQHIKNPYTANARTCKQLRAAHRLVLTGTPLENSLGEVWSLFDFLLPSYLRTHREFRRDYETRAAAGETAAVAGELAPLLHPFVLRRTKAAVCSELPPKIEQVLYCDMPDEQRRVYETLLAAGRHLLARGRAHWQGCSVEMLSLLLRLRQACCHPGLLPRDMLPESSGPVPSAKLELAREVILEAIDSGHRILVFSQFTSVLALFPEWLHANAIAFEYLDGATLDRQERVDRFNRDRSIAVFLLSLKAGGTGLNLTGADTVVHYDPWWNPMVEDQATDRAHRIGQTQTVTAIRLVVRQSIEERILQLQAAKRELFNRMLEGAPAGLAALRADDIAFLLDPQVATPNGWQ